MKTFIDYPSRKLQADSYTGPISISEYQRFTWLRGQLKEEGVNITIPSGN
jgi:arylsulfatase